MVVLCWCYKKHFFYMFTLFTFLGVQYVCTGELLALVSCYGFGVVVVFGGGGGSKVTPQTYLKKR